MSIKQEFRDARESFRLLSLYQRFEYVVIIILTALIAVIVIAAVWNLSLKILFGLVLSGSLDPSDYSVFQAVFGMIFTVIIALEFKKSLLVVAERRDTVVQIRSVVVIALLGFVPLYRARSARRWKAALDAYAEREIARDRRFRIKFGRST